MSAAHKIFSRVWCRTDVPIFSNKLQARLLITISVWVWSCLAISFVRTKAQHKCLCIQAFLHAVMYNACLFLHLKLGSKIDDLLGFYMYFFCMYLVKPSEYFSLPCTNPGGHLAQPVPVHVCVCMRAHARLCVCMCVGALVPAHVCVCQWGTI